MTTLCFVSWDVLKSFGIPKLPEKVIEFETYQSFYKPEDRRRITKTHLLFLSEVVIEGTKIRKDRHDWFENADTIEQQAYRLLIHNLWEEGNHDGFSLVG